MLTAIVITLNEEKKLKGCLDSLKWADEVLVVDSGSTDKTIEIAKRSAAKVFIDKTLKGFRKSRNLGLKLAKNEWVLYVDADERVTPELASEISKIIYNKDNQKAGMYAIPRKNIILGKELKHGWWPDYVKRLFYIKNLRGWKGELHEEPVFSGETRYLKSPLVHFKHEKLEEMLEKTNKWSAMEAKLMFDANHPPMNLLRFASAISREFWLRMVKQKAFLDGAEGVIYAIYQVFSRFLSYSKLWELQLNSSKLKVKS